MSYHGYVVYDVEDDEWRDIPGFPGYYISNTGHVWGPKRNGKGGLLYPTRIGECGHLDVSLYVNGVRKHRYIHRLVAEAFIPNPNNYPIVRHLDDDPLNNDVENLAWGTSYDNVHDCIKNLNFRYFTDEDIEKANETVREPTVLVNLKNGEVYDFDSRKEAAEFINVSPRDISNCCRGARQHIGIWKAFSAEDYDNEECYAIEDLNRYRKKAQIRAINLETGESLYFNGQTEASNVLGISISSISMILSGKAYASKGWTFEYEEDYND